MVIHRQYFFDRHDDRLPESTASPLQLPVCEQLFRADMTENDGDREQSCLPAQCMKVMPDVFAMVMWLLMLMHLVGRQRPAAPLAAMRLRVHLRKHPVEVPISHVMPACQIPVRQRPAVV